VGGESSISGAETLIGYSISQVKLKFGEYVSLASGLALAGYSNYSRVIDLHSMYSSLVLVPKTIVESGIWIDSRWIKYLLTATAKNNILV